MNPKKENLQLLTIDIGGTSVKFALYKCNELKQHTSFYTPRQHLEAMTINTIAHIYDNYNIEEIDGIAISSTGLVHPKEKTLGMGSTFYEAFGKDFVGKLTEQFRLPISLENDGNCAALAELWKGNAQENNDVLVVVIGTAIGGSVIREREIIRGANELAGEFGFVLYPQEDGDFSILSKVASTQAIVENYAKEMGIGVHTIDGKKLFQLEKSGDTVAKKWIEFFIRNLAIQLYNLQYIYDPEKILIGGGVSKADYFTERVNSVLQEIKSKVKCTIVLPEVAPCKFGNDANLIGAAYVWHKEYIEGKK